MSNKESFDSKNNNTTNDDSKWFQNLYDDKCGQEPTSKPNEEVERIEDGLSMQIMKFIGLPQSYTNSLYNEFVQDVKQIPTETAGSLYKIFNWVRGENKGDKKEDTCNVTGEGDASLERLSNSSLKATDVPEKGDILEIDSVANLKIVTPFGIAAEKEQQVTKTVDVEPFNYDENRLQATDFQDGNFGPAYNNNFSAKSDCSSCESSVFDFVYDKPDSACEGDNETHFTAIETRMHKENEEEVKRVKFAPFSENNIHEYQQDCEDDPKQEPQSRKISNSVLATELINDNIAGKNFTNYNESGSISDNEIYEEDEQVCNGNNKVNYTSHISHTIHQSSVKKLEPVDDVGKVASYTEIGKPITQPLNDVPRPTTSEVQLQLNSDLKTLEETVKNIYKNLNKKGPLTIVANFKSMEDGELAVDMSSSLKGKSKLKKIKSEKSILQTEKGRMKPLMSLTDTPSIEQPIDNARQYKINGFEQTDVSQRMESIKQQLQAKPDLQQPIPFTIRKSLDISTSQEHSLPSPARKPPTTQPKAPVSKLPLKTVVEKKMSDQNDNSLVDRGSSPLIPSLKMSVLRPAASSHSLTETSISTPHKEDVEVPKLKISRSKQYKTKAPSSHHVLVKRYKVLKTTNSLTRQRLLVPITLQLEQLYVSNDESTPDPGSQHICLKASPMQRSHVKSETVDTQRAQHLLADHSSQNSKHNVPSISVQHIPVKNPLPPTSKSPRLHLRNSTTANRFHQSQILSSQSQLQRSSNSLTQPWRTRKEFQQHPPQQKHGERYVYKRDTEESPSTISVASSVSSVTFSSNRNTSCISESEPVSERIMSMQLDNTCNSTTHTNSTYRNHSNASRKPYIQKIVSSSSVKSFRTTTTHVPSSKPSKHSSYSAIFKEKQQQRQPLQVDHSQKSKGIPKNK